MTMSANPIAMGGITPAGVWMTHMPMVRTRKNVPIISTINFLGFTTDLRAKVEGGGARVPTISATIPAAARAEAGRFGESEPRGLPGQAAQEDCKVKPLRSFTQRRGVAAEDAEKSNPWSLPPRPPRQLRVSA